MPTATRMSSPWPAAARECRRRDAVPATVQDTGSASRSATRIASRQSSCGTAGVRRRAPRPVAVVEGAQPPMTRAVARRPPPHGRSGLRASGSGRPIVGRSAPTAPGRGGPNGRRCPRRPRPGRAARRRRRVRRRARQGRSRPSSRTPHPARARGAPRRRRRAVARLHARTARRRSGPPIRPAPPRAGAARSASAPAATAGTVRTPQRQCGCRRHPRRPPRRPARRPRTGCVGGGRAVRSDSSRRAAGPPGRPWRIVGATGHGQRQLPGSPRRSEPSLGSPLVRRNLSSS